MTTSKNTGLIGTLKIAAALLVILLALLAMLMVMNVISMDQFKSYLMTVTTVILIGTFAGVVIAMLVRPDK